MTNRLFVFMPVLVLGLGALAITGMREQFVMQPVRPLTSIAPILLGVQGRDVPIAEEEQKIAGMSDFMLREYRPDSSTLFTVYVGYYDRQVQGRSIHSPKNCLPGAGWEILDSSRKPMTMAAVASQVNRVLLANHGTRALVYYWYQGRGRIESSEYKVKWDLMRDAALYGRTEEALVRIVIPIRTPSTSEVAWRGQLASADSLALVVTSQLLPDLERVMPTAPNSR